MSSAIFKIRFMIPMLALVSFSCDHQTTEIAAVPEIRLDGKELMEKNCYSCHNTQGTDNMLAPPMHRVKDHYWYDGITKDEFVTKIVAWCENPSEENSLMPGARRKFGLMPTQEFDKNEVEAIASYLYDQEMGNAGCSSCGSNCSHQH